MEEKIFNLVYDYAINDKLADESFIEQIILIVTDSRNLGDYVKNIEFSDEIKQDKNVVECARYANILQKITINLESTKIVIEDRLLHKKPYEKFEENLFQNLIIVQFILHELEHAYQYKILDDKEDDTFEFGRRFAGCKTY